MNKEIVFNQGFKESLLRSGAPLEDIQADIFADAQRGKPNPIRVIRGWTGLPNDEIRNGLVNETRDEVQPQIGKAILEAVMPWIVLAKDQGLPELQAKELARKTGLSSTKVINTLRDYPFVFSVNGSRLQTAVEVPIFPKQDEERMSLTDSRKYRVSAKRITKAARYMSRPPGGGPAQKIGFQNKRVPTLIKEAARENTRIVFIDTKQNPEQEKKLKEKQDEMENIAEILYFFEGKSYGKNVPLRKRNIIVQAEKVKKRLMESNELLLFVPWGVRPQGTPRLEIIVMDRLKAIEANLRQKGINAKILIMPADLYATEVNNQVRPSQALAYFEYVAKEAQERGFAVKPWSSIREENFIAYQKRREALTDEAIKEFVGPAKMEMAMGASSRRSGYKDRKSIEKAAYTYLRERIIEGEIIESVYKPIKVSVVARVRDEIVDGELPRIYLFSPDLQFPWLK